MTPRKNAERELSSTAGIIEKKQSSSSSSWFISAASFTNKWKCEDLHLSSPTCIAGALSLLLCVTTTQYFFNPPQLNTAAAQQSFRQKISTDEEADEVKKLFENYYGTPDAEFDWCEENYIASIPIRLPNIPLVSYFTSPSTSATATASSSASSIEIIDLPVAEYWNTLSSLLYVFPPALVLCLIKLKI